VNFFTIKLKHEGLLFAVICNRRFLFALIMLQFNNISSLCERFIFLMPNFGVFSRNNEGFSIKHVEKTKKSKEKICCYSVTKALVSWHQVFSHDARLSERRLNRTSFYKDSSYLLVVDQCLDKLLLLFLWKLVGHF
jgi:hypothetical protein